MPAAADVKNGSTAGLQKCTGGPSSRRIDATLPLRSIFMCLLPGAI